ncbi:hypothetical protein KFL_009310070 [Klebsormidium nitens]|uniref:Uncharacterized protein n=1 Tax=Klebsormidium nitens TaxID=105231 RepID=A0A1Y1IQ25_KLENI|nr:hypothetical protein KFL_009310070 [Klebsormidium nitens]|eukprot:GAQ92142.1 hypothetical protein KFL_009310070 [Klebsormidium nitens]
MEMFDPQKITFLGEQKLLAVYEGRTLDDYGGAGEPDQHGEHHAWPQLLPPLANSAVKMLKKFAAADKLPVTTINQAAPFGSGEEL